MSVTGAVQGGSPPRPCLGGWRGWGANLRGMLLWNSVCLDCYSVCVSTGSKTVLTYDCHLRLFWTVPSFSLERIPVLDDKQHGHSTRWLDDWAGLLWAGISRDLMRPASLSSFVNEGALSKAWTSSQLPCSTFLCAFGQSHKKGTVVHYPFYMPCIPFLIHASSMLAELN